MTNSRQNFVTLIESYYTAVDRLDTEAIVSHFTPDAVMAIPSGDIRHEGHEAIRATYVRRASEVDESFHGDFTHVVDTDNGRAATRLAARRKTKDGRSFDMDCIAMFAFDGDLIKNIAIWMSGENSLK
jgi:ketosteroid isomerase-like protein